MKRVVKSLISIVTAAIMIMGLFMVQGINAHADGSGYLISYSQDGGEFTYGGTTVNIGDIIPAKSPLVIKASSKYTGVEDDETKIIICVDGVTKKTVRSDDSATSPQTGFYFVGEGSSTKDIKYVNFDCDDHIDKCATYILEFETVQDPQDPESSAAKSDYVPHEHSYAYTVITEPTENSVGEAAWVCSCGDSKDHVILPTIDVLMDNRVTQITQAKAGQDIVLNMGLTNSLPNWFMQKISEKNDVNFKIIIKYDHKKYEISIPRGTEIDLSCDWYGPAKLMELYETTQLN